MAPGKIAFKFTSHPGDFDLSVSAFRHQKVHFGVSHEGINCTEFFVVVNFGWVEEPDPERPGLIYMERCVITLRHISTEAFVGPIDGNPELTGKLFMVERFAGNWGKLQLAE